MTLGRTAGHPALWMVGREFLLGLTILVYALLPAAWSQEADETWRLKPPKPLLMPESHLGTTPWAEHHVKVTMYSAKPEVLYEVDNEGTWTKYTEELVILEPGIHTVRAVSVDEGILSENATAIYKVAAVARVSEPRPLSLQIAASDALTLSLSPLWLN